jgi:hypothetical protein
MWPPPAPRGNSVCHVDSFNFLIIHPGLSENEVMEL